jgi:hypothetical protein
MSTNLIGTFRSAPRLLAVAAVTLLAGGATPAIAAGSHKPARAHIAVAKSAASCVSSWFASCWRPYSSTSPFNLTLPASPSVTSNSAAVVAAMNAGGPPEGLLAGPTVGYETVFYTDPSAPIYTVHCTEPWGTCAVEGAQLHIPPAALPAPNPDHHMVVIDAKSNVEYDFWQTGSLPAGGGQLNISWGGQTSVTGAGLNSNSNAATFGGLAGIVRASELQAGHIDHALVLSVKCDNGTFVWPATKSDYRCADGSGPAMGAHLQLNMTTTQINALAVPAWKKTVLRAFATYGAFVEDTGNDPWTIKFEAGQTYTSLGKADPMLAFAKSNAWSYWAPDNDYVGDLGSGVPWTQLRVIAPCVAQRTC